MAERPIIFNAPMVRAILAGRKTQTRRVLKNAGVEQHWHPEITTSGAWILVANHPDCQGRISANVRHSVRDLLWVRESWRTELRNDDIAPRNLRRGLPVYYEAGGGGEETIPACAGRLRPSIHMPRWTSRITLEVTGVKVERLNEISEEDAVAEGVLPQLGDGGGPGPGYKWRGIGYHGAGFDAHGEPTFHVSRSNRRCACRVGWRSPAQCAFRELWASIHGAGSWDANPWVAAISFERVATPDTGAGR